jgi:hypothetical protein
MRLQKHIQQHIKDNSPQKQAHIPYQSTLFKPYGMLTQSPSNVILSSDIIRLCRSLTSLSSVSQIHCYVSVEVLLSYFMNHSRSRSSSCQFTTFALLLTLLVAEDSEDLTMDSGILSRRTKLYSLGCVAARPSGLMNTAHGSC